MKILSNGSKFAGEKPDNVEKLIEVLGKHKLDPRFLTLGNNARFVSQIEGTTEFQAFGNFEDISHVFDIRGTLEEMRPLMRAIKENRKRNGI